MSFLGFRKKNTKKVTEGGTEAIHVGVDAAVRKKQQEQREKKEEIILEDYTPNYEETILPVEESFVSNKTTEEAIEFLEENCRQINEAQQHVDNAKIEYQAVCEYLSDVQKVERMPDGERKLLNDSALKIVNLTKEREDYQNRTVFTDNPCFRAIRKHEDTLMEELKNMRDAEQYKKVIENDMRQIKAEKKALGYDYKNIPSNQSELKKITVALTLIVVSLFALFFALQFGMEQDMKIPFMLTAMMAAVALAYIAYESHRNKVEYAILEKQINRAIQVENKIKIKYINNTSSLDYSHSKYGVKNSMELEYLIKEYKKAKEAERTYESNTDRLQHYREKVVDILKVQELKDTEIWLHQLNVLLSKQEFEEMKASLEDRREKLIEKMDYNLQVKDRYFNHMHMVLDEKPELKSTLLEMMKTHNISLG
ncbi:MAG: hypothetical protein II838_01690 [Lachnospiraceae bacterium]|jgi:hypothetical protein|nr:hypothetical protein [Lachnospiraceae bacterium]